MKYVICVNILLILSSSAYAQAQPLHRSFPVLEILTVVAIVSIVIFLIIKNARKQDEKNQNDSHLNAEFDKKSSTNPKVFSKIAAAIVIFSILFLPVIGCGNDSLNGAEIIENGNVSDEIKVFLIVSIASAVMIFFLKKYIQIAIMSITGIVTLLISYLLAQDKIKELELKAGSILALLAFLTSAIIGFANNKSANPLNTYHGKQPPPSDNRDSFVQIEKLNELKEKGILTEEEFNVKKKELLGKI